MLLQLSQTIIATVYLRDVQPPWTHYAINTKLPWTHYALVPDPLDTLYGTEPNVKLVFITARLQYITAHLGSDML